MSNAEAIADLADAVRSLAAAITALAGREKPAPDVTQAAPPGFGTGPIPQHTSNFSGIYWPGLGTFFFNGNRQRAAIAALWKSREAGQPFVDQQVVIRASGTHATRLCDVFRSQGKTHKVWGTLIQKGPVRGTYRLPEEPQLSSPEKESIP